MGQTVVGPAVLVRFTWFGDANLDTTVDSIDFNLLASNFGAINKHWSDGDFNYDHTVNTTDFNLLASNFGKALPGDSIGATGTLVPEPASAMLAIALTSCLAAGRRRPRAIDRHR